MSAYVPQTYFTGNETYKEINPILSKVGDFTAFYIAITICSIILGFLLILNIVCCCSRYSDYWLDRHTGNRWIVSIWSATPHKQPPLDYTELEGQYQYAHETVNPEAQRLPQPPTSMSRQLLTTSHEYFELQKRESDI